jgi:hypothetical protein
MNWVLCPAPPGPFLGSCKRYGVILMLSVALEEAFLRPLPDHTVARPRVFQQIIHHHALFSLFPQERKHLCHLLAHPAASNSPHLSCTCTQPHTLLAAHTTLLLSYVRYCDVLLLQSQWRRTHPGQAPSNLGTAGKFRSWEGVGCY